MPDRTPLETLHHDYGLLLRKSPLHLTVDQQRSRRYFVAELTLLEPFGGASGAGEPCGWSFRWAFRMRELELFITRENRMPRQDNRHPDRINADERRLAEWVRTQRAAAKQGTLCQYQARRLACVPAYSARPRDDVWREHLIDYQCFTTATGMAPRVRSVDQAECRLARWADKQRYFRRTGRLSQDRVNALSSLSFWTWGPSIPRKAKRVNVFV